jgi:hypothetical protein
LASEICSGKTSSRKTPQQCDLLSSLTKAGRATKFFLKGGKSFAVFLLDKEKEK